ncbi:MAG: DUF4469 domain-containing protein [Dysgonamonadaceae bacterium]|jgi:hypothetical protein|nr:DUF4469 domain-containing protein [Dysgonamonadaceae bacterium]
MNELPGVLYSSYEYYLEPVVQLKVDYVEDVKSGTTNQYITIGGTVKIFGHNLRIVGTNPTVGVEFIGTEPQAPEYPVPAVDIVVNNPSELLVVAPDLPSEEVALRITTQYSGNTSILLKDSRSTVFEKIFTVK